VCVTYSTYYINKENFYSKHNNAGHINHVLKSLDLKLQIMRIKDNTFQWSFKSYFIYSILHPTTIHVPNTASHPIRFIPGVTTFSI
jgi:hypothetical protein